MDDAYLTRAVREAEAPLLAALPQLADGTSTLMDRAAFALANEVVGVLRAGRAPGPPQAARVLALVGPGDNGRDALRALVHLGRRGVRGHAVDAGTEPDAVGFAMLARADVVLDAVVGLGGHGGLRPPAAVWARAVEAERDARASGAAGVGFGSRGRRRLTVVAVDLPSGVEVDDGTVRGPVLAADRTVTFGAVKPCLLLPPAAHLAGEVVVIDLGLDGLGAPAVRALGDDDVARSWPIPGHQADKYGRGVLGVVAGGDRFPGAAVLAVSAAVRAGVGMVRYIGPVRTGAAVVAARPEVLAGTAVDEGRVQAWVAGCGVDPHDAEQAARVREALGAALRDELPIVLDAGALAVCAERLGEGVPGTVVLTPHAGELATLLTVLGVDAGGGRDGQDNGRGRGDRGDRAAVGDVHTVSRADVEAAPRAHASAAHAATGATIVLKGAITVVVGAGPGRAAHGGADAPAQVFAQGGAPGWLATAGAGDVLAGVLGALLAGRASDLAGRPGLVPGLAAAAVHLHGRAAHRAEPGGPVSAGAVADALPGALAAMLARGAGSGGGECGSITRRDEARPGVTGPGGAVG